MPGSSENVMSHEEGVEVLDRITTHIAHELAQLIGHLRIPALQIADELEKLGIPNTLENAESYTMAIIASGITYKVAGLLTESKHMINHDLAKRMTIAATERLMRVVKSDRPPGAVMN